MKSGCGHGSTRAGQVAASRCANGCLSAPPDDRKAIDADIKTVEFGMPIGMPVCRPLGDGLWEIRSNISDGQIARVLFCIAQNQMILLHGFIKKTQKTPTSDLELERRRM